MLTHLPTAVCNYIRLLKNNLLTCMAGNIRRRCLVQLKLDNTISFKSEELLNEPRQNLQGKSLQQQKQQKLLLAIWCHQSFLKIFLDRRRRRDCCRIIRNYLKLDDVSVAISTVGQPTAATNCPMLLLM